MKFIKFLLNTAIYVAIVAGLVFGLPKLLVRTLDTQYPMAAITSGSMWPALKTGDLVLIQGVAKEELEVGDIIVFNNKETGVFTIHRIVKLSDKTLQTKGDANFDSDRPVAYEDVVGRLLTIKGHNVRIPLLGNITMLVQGVSKSYASRQ